MTWREYVVIGITLVGAWLDFLVLKPYLVVSSHGRILISILPLDLLPMSFADMGRPTMMGAFCLVAK